MNLILSSFKINFQRSCRVHKNLFNNEPFLRYIGFRNLIAPSVLGMDRFSYKRKKAQNEFAEIREKFIYIMKKMYQDKEAAHINFQDLKNVMYICENNETELHLLQYMIINFVPDGGYYGSDALDLEYLRLLHYLKLPNQMRKGLNEKETSKLFEKKISYAIAMSLFYDYKLYNDILDTYHQMISKYVPDRTSMLQTIFAMAACYHLDSSSSLQEATSIIKKQEEKNIQLDARSLSFASALALKQNQAHVALELTSKAKWNSYLLKNIKILALIAAGRGEDTLPILRGYTGGFSGHPSNDKTNVNVILSSTLLSVNRALSHSGNIEALSEFNIIKKDLEERALISHQSLSKVLIEPVEISRTNNNRARTMIEGSFEKGTIRGKAQKTFSHVGFKNVDKY